MKRASGLLIQHIILGLIITMWMAMPPWDTWGAVFMGLLSALGLFLIWLLHIWWDGIYPKGKKHQGVDKK